MADTKITWTDKVWNPVTGCTKISEGCRNCYAEGLFKRFGKQWGHDFNEIICKSERLNEPLKWKKSSKIFVCSMGDLFHDEVPEIYLWHVFDAMWRSAQHTYLILTKRPKNMKRFFERIDDNHPNGPSWNLCPSPNIWLGVTAENQKEADRRIPILLNTPAAKRFVSIEPMLEGVDIKHYLDGMPEPCGGGINYVSKEMASDACCPEMEGMPIAQEPEWQQTSPPLSWVIVGAESGSKRRPCNIEWIRDIVRQCKEASVPVFVKQMEIKGKITTNPNYWPEDLRIQEFPK